MGPLIISSKASNPSILSKQFVHDKIITTFFDYFFSIFDFRKYLKTGNLHLKLLQTRFHDTLGTSAVLLLYRCVQFSASIWKTLLVDKWLFVLKCHRLYKQSKFSCFKLKRPLPVAKADILPVLISSSNFSSFCIFKKSNFSIVIKTHFLGDIDI